MPSFLFSVDVLSAFLLSSNDLNLLLRSPYSLLPEKWGNSKWENVAFTAKKQYNNVVPDI